MLLWFVYLDAFHLYDIDERPCAVEEQLGTNEVADVHNYRCYRPPDQESAKDEYHQSWGDEPHPTLSSLVDLVYRLLLRDFPLSRHACHSIIGEGTKEEHGKVEDDPPCHEPGEQRKNNFHKHLLE